MRNCKYDSCLMFLLYHGVVSTGILSRGTPDRTICPCGRLSLWKWVPGISPGVKAADAFGWRPTTLVVPKRQEIRGLNLTGTPWATSACRGTHLTSFYLHLLQSVTYIQFSFTFRKQLENEFYIWVSVHHKSIIHIYNKPTRCDSGSILFIKNYKYALHVSDSLCVHLQDISSTNSPPLNTTLYSI